MANDLPGLGLKVLVVDDDEPVLEVLADMVASLGAEVATATSVSEARLVLELFDPSLVMTDVYMPGENGLVMRALMRHRNPDVPVIALTGGRDADMPLDAGFVFRLRKPLLLETLRAVLADVAIVTAKPAVA